MGGTALAEHRRARVLGENGNCTVKPDNTGEYPSLPPSGIVISRKRSMPVGRQPMRDPDTHFRSKRLSGMALARSNVMPILEARFYPRSKSDPSFVVVGKVTLENGVVAIEPASLSQRNIAPFDGEGLQLKLRFIVDCATTDPYPELLHLRSDFWAFVDPTRPSQP